MASGGGGGGRGKALQEWDRELTFELPSKWRGGGGGVRCLLYIYSFNVHQVDAVIPTFQKRKLKFPRSHLLKVPKSEDG